MVLNARDTISGALGECYTNEKGSYEPLITLKDVEWSWEKNMIEVPRLGTTMMGNKSGQVTLKGTATLYYCSPRFRKMALDYINFGRDTYFDMKVINKDPTSGVGEQVAIITGCNVSSGILAKLDVEGDVLDEEIEMTAEGVIMEQNFNEPEGGFNA